MGPEYHIDKIWSALLVIFHAKQNVEKWFDFFLFLELTITMVATYNLDWGPLNWYDESN